MLVENPNSGKSHFARVKIPGNMPRLVPVDDLTDEESREERFGSSRWRTSSSRTSNPCSPA